MRPSQPSHAVPSTLMAAVALATTLLTWAPTPLAAQDASRPEADPADVASDDAILAAVYDVISGPAGQARDWDRFRSLFIDGARLIPSGRPPDADRVQHRVMTVDEYVQGAAALERNGFFEREIGRSTQRFGSVVHALSAYESRRAAADPEPFIRGVNSFQLLDDGTRWWIVTIYWTSETPDNPIPPELGGGR